MKPSSGWVGPSPPFALSAGHPVIVSSSYTDSVSLQQRCRPIELLVLDVDGVLTDGRIVYDAKGIELKAFHVRDGVGLKLWREAGKRVAILTGRTSHAVEVRAAELGIEHVIQGASEKLPAFERLLEEEGLQHEQACYLGDDLPDLPVLLSCGLAVTVADACGEVQEAAHHVTQAGGGQGAVRETVELILRAQGWWETIVLGYRQRAQRAAGRRLPA